MSTLRYCWEIKAVSLESWEDVAVRCDNACTRCVPFPEQWRTGLRFVRIGGAIQQAVEVAKDNTRYDVQCALLGLPKSAPVAGAPGAPGAAVETHAAIASARRCDCWTSACGAPTSALTGLLPGLLPLLRGGASDEAAPVGSDETMALSELKE